MKEVIFKNGYIAKGHGYTKTTDENTHWITLFEGGSLQMYSYLTEDSEFEKTYDTGIIKIHPIELQTLITILTSNHN